MKLILSFSVVFLFLFSANAGSCLKIKGDNCFHVIEGYQYNRALTVTVGSGRVLTDHSRYQVIRGFSVIEKNSSGGSEELTTGLNTFEQAKEVLDYIVLQTKK